MESRLVLIVEDDERTADSLATAIRGADYEVVVSPTAEAGLEIAFEARPDCIVCDTELPDHDGYWVARHIRTHSSPVSVTPFLFLSESDDAAARLEGFHVGADVYMTKPFRAEEVVAQVDALVQMAARLRQRRDSMLSLPPEASYGTTAIEGDLRHMSVATVLSVLGMERRTGLFEVTSRKRRAQLEMAVGYLAFGMIGGTPVDVAEALRVMMSWKAGRFSFTTLPPCEPPSSRRTVQAMLLDIAREEDEAAAAASQKSARRSAPPAGAMSLGGPPSRPDDTAPPSSRAMREAAEAPISIAFDLVPSTRSAGLTPIPSAALVPDGAPSALRASSPQGSDPFRGSSTKTPVTPLPAVRAITEEPSGVRRAAANQVVAPDRLFSGTEVRGAHGEIEPAETTPRTPSNDRGEAPPSPGATLLRPVNRPPRPASTPAIAPPGSPDVARPNLPSPPATPRGLVAPRGVSPKK